MGSTTYPIEDFTQNTNGQCCELCAVACEVLCSKADSVSLVGVDSKVQCGYVGLLGFNPVDTRLSLLSYLSETSKKEAIGFCKPKVVVTGGDVVIFVWGYEGEVGVDGVDCRMEEGYAEC